MQPVLHTPFVLETPLPPDASLARLPHAGWQRIIEGETFRLSRDAAEVAGAQILVEGRAWPGEDGALLEGTVALLAEPASWTSHLAPFAAEAEGVLAALAAAIGASARSVAPVIADPALEGAEIAAPAALEVSVDRDRVTLTLHGPFRPTRADRTRSLVTIHSGGLLLAGDWHRGPIGWDDLARCAIHHRPDLAMLTLFDRHDTAVARLGCVGCADDEWLAGYLDAHIERRHPQAEERDADARERARISALVGGVRRDEP